MYSEDSQGRRREVMYVGYGPRISPAQTVESMSEMRAFCHSIRHSTLLRNMEFAQTATPSQTR
jgi:hypothetical protein